jgi:hypothetical protein
MWLSLNYRSVVATACLDVIFSSSSYTCASSSYLLGAASSFQRSDDGCDGGDFFDFDIFPSS